ncbi:flagellar hook protein FlgE [Formivibrio citricus]|uniref:Flagellar hook protein FlgE n=1 Tax=Formivibrio citricus TaxID=83765 RepID=A0A1I4ZWI6_9NEIS|nr:flagellar hook protein FlgE [Formivibrio citricus]SFN54359.1 flagellar hook protein FlgE [Formivibrio citricus]
MGFQQGLSGLNAASKSLDVIGNNVANSNTVGFKSSRAEFGDIYAATFGSASNLAGIGAKTLGISQQFGQGNISSTSNPLDLAISGNGFYQIYDSPTTQAASYTRNGQFQLDKDGYIITNTGRYLTGWQADSATNFLPSSGPVSPIQVKFANFGAQETGGSGVSGAGLSVGLNLNSSDSVKTAVFSMADPTTYNYSTSATVYDTLGVAHTQTMYFVKGGYQVGAAPDDTVTNTWSVYYALDGSPVLPDGTLGTSATTQDAMLRGTLTFTSSGAYSSYASNVVTTSPHNTGAISRWFYVTPTALGNGSNGLDFQMFFDKATQYGSNYNVSTLTQDGYTDGSLTGLSVSKEGVVQGRYSNGQSRDVARIALYTFNNSQGLQPLGDNRWAVSYASGAALPNAPGAGNAGLLTAAAVEDSNVDMTAELVNLITAQRNYQANAQTIKAQDTILQTLVSLR